jgi:hypothetical protein
VLIPGQVARKEAMIRERTTIPLPSTAPPAPITSDKMKTWTPPDIFEAAARERLAEQKAGRATSQPAGATTTDLTPWLIGAGVVGAISLVLILTR